MKERMRKQRKSNGSKQLIIKNHSFVAVLLVLALSLAAQTIPTCRGLRFPRFSTAKVNLGKDKNGGGKKWWRGIDLEKDSSSNDNNNDNNDDDDDDSNAFQTPVLSSLQLEPLLQVPCAVQLMKNLSDKSAVSKQLAIGAFCDTGAQRTCMSWDAAKRVGLAHLLDRRYAGQATGVGFCRVLGRIPAQTVLLHFSGAAAASDDDTDDGGKETAITIMAPAITILESTGIDGVELLFGLDFLRDAQALIDLQEEYVRLTGVHVKRKEEAAVIDVAFIRPRQSIMTDLEDNDDGNSIEQTEGPTPTPKSLRQQVVDATGGDSDNEEDEDSDEDIDTPVDMSGL